MAAPKIKVLPNPKTMGPMVLTVALGTVLGLVLYSGYQDQKQQKLLTGGA